MDAILLFCVMYAAVPGKPEELWLKGKATDSMTVCWRPPLNDGGKPVTGYVVEIREVGSETWTEYVSCLNASILDVNLSVCFILRYVVCWSVAD